MKEKEWTIMIYMAGDNNLAVDMAYAMEQIKQAVDEGKNSPNLFVYYDGNSPDIPTIYCDFSEPRNPKYVRSFKVPDKLYPVPAKHNENAADIKSVFNFVDWCLNKVEVENNGEISYGRRAQKYAMIFSGHSLGFQDIGLFKDETSGKTMKMRDLYEMLGRLTDSKEFLEKTINNFDLAKADKERETTVLLGQKLELLGFDSCVMGMLEVGYQFYDVAKMMIASEGSVPNAGWTYAKILRSLASGNKLEGNEKVVENFVREFIKSQDSYTVGGVSVDMAAWDLSRFSKLVAAFDGLAVTLIDCFADENSRIYRQMERVILQVHWKCQSYMYDQNVDLGDFCELLDIECGRIIDEIGDGEDLDALRWVQEACRNVLKELREAVILSGFSGGAYQYSNGVSVFFPWSRETYEVSRKNYEGLWFSKEAVKTSLENLSWTGFLKKYLFEIAVRRLEPPTEKTPSGSKYRYFSGISFDEELTFNASENQMTKIAGQQNSKIAGQQNSKIAGQQNSKIAGQQNSKIAGQQNSKIAGQQNSKIAGQLGSKMGVGGTSAFFESLRLFKNIESSWNISGFTKKPE